ncbi:MAG: Na/Pi cotransporter family protein [Bacteroidales bacterium]|nr:Na/Pi cotransporter family protein [Bacteroidales bacterium]
MNYGILDVLNLLGSLALFLFGMKLMSESLQKVAGNGLRSFLASMTSNPFKQILTGLLVTVIVQSSSATTVMTVSFVNAGLLTLSQSVGIIMGANIGTTATAWIIATLGFKFDLSTISVPLIALGFVLMMLKSAKHKTLGQMVIGFALLFMGLGLLKGSVPDLNSSPETLAFVQSWTQYGFGSVLLFVLIGTLLTIVLQASAATMALTLVMVNFGWIPFEMAAAMVLGENIGTTITVNLAAIIGNTSAKRTARAHTAFNIFGVVWVLLLFRPFMWLVANIIEGCGFADPRVPFAQTASSSPELASTTMLYAVATVHSLFNIANTAILVWFVPGMVRLVSWLVPDGKEDEEFRLVHIDTGMMATAELSLLQANKEVITFGRRVHRMFGFVRILMDETNERDFDKLYERIEKYESISDRIELEIANFLNGVSNYELSTESSRKMQAMFREISEIESVADSCYSLARTIKRRRDLQVDFGQDLRNNITQMFDRLDEAFALMHDNLDRSQQPHPIIDLTPAYEAEERINSLQNRYKEEHIHNVETNRYKYLTGVVYCDMFNEAEKMGDYLINVSEAVSEVEQPITEKRHTD